MNKLFILLIVLFMGASFLQAKNLTILKSIRPSNIEQLDIEIEGDKMIIPAGIDGAILYDISDPVNPRRLYNMNLLGCKYNRTYNWDIQGNIAIGAARECGMGIFDTSQKENPVLLAYVNPDENLFPRQPSLEEISLEDVEISGDKAVFAAHGDGLLLYNISKPRAPLFLSHISTNNAWSLAINNNIVYVADGEGGLAIMDMSNAKMPVRLAQHSTSGHARDIRYQDGLVFMALGAGGVNVFDVSDPAQPQFLSNFKTSGFASRIALDRDLVFVSAWNELQVLKWDGTTLRLDGYKNTGGRVMAVGSPGGNIVYSAEWRLLQIMQYGIIDAPDIDLSTRIINFSHLEAGETETHQVNIKNNGTMILDIPGIGSTHSDFTINPTQLQINPGEKDSINVLYTANSQNAAGTIEFFSNDPDEQSTTIKVNGNKKFGVDVGVIAPDFELPIIANGSGTFRLSQNKGEIVVIALFATW